MQAVANLVEPTRTAADIGCDHAYISIWLCDNEIALKVIATDINEGPLAIARQNIKEAGFSDRISTRLSDGASAIRPGEADCLILAGMGGELIIKILTDSLPVVAQAHQLVLSPQSDVEKTRHAVEEMGFYLNHEEMVEEDGKFYVCMDARRIGHTFWEEKDGSFYEKPVFYRYGRNLLTSRNPVLYRYLCRRKEQLSAILEHLPEGSETEGPRRELEAKLSLTYEALSYFDPKYRVGI